MITIEVSKCHCEIVREAILEAFPFAQAAGVNVGLVEKCMGKNLLDQETIMIVMDDPTWQAVLDTLRHHPQPHIGDFFIHHLQDLVADSLLGYTN
jgi:hypothetical protein